MDVACSVQGLKNTLQEYIVIQQWQHGVFPAPTNFVSADVPIYGSCLFWDHCSLKAFIYGCLPKHDFSHQYCFQYFIVIDSIIKKPNMQWTFNNTLNLISQCN